MQEAGRQQDTGGNPWKGKQIITEAGNTGLEEQVFTGVGNIKGQQEEDGEGQKQRKMGSLDNDTKR